MTGLNRSWMGLGPGAGSSGGAVESDQVVYATVNPTAVDDSGYGYVAGRTRWLNTATDTLYLLVDATLGAAIWTAVGSSGAVVPTGTGFTHITAGVQDGAAKLVENADVHATAGIALTKLATQAASTILGNNTAGAAVPTALTAAQTKTLLAIAAGDVSGLATVATSGSAADLGAGILPLARLSGITDAQVAAANKDGAAATASMRTLGAGAAQAAAGNDARFTDARTPTAHVTTHAPGGSDAIPWTTAHGRGTTAAKPAAAAGNTGYLYYDTDLQKMQRSTGAAWEDVSVAPGAPSAHATTHAPGGSDALPWTTVHGRGNTASKPAAAAGNAGYLYFDTDLVKMQRSTGAAWEDVSEAGGGAPAAHAASHKSGGSDAIKLDELAAPTDVTTLNASTSAHGLMAKLPGTLGSLIDSADGAWKSVRKLLSTVEDFEGASSKFAGTTTGTGAGLLFTTGEAGTCGICTLATGTTTTGKAALGMLGAGVIATIILGSGTCVFDAIIRMPLLSDATENWTVRIGLSDAAGGTDPVDGVYFRYNHGVNAGKFQAVTRSNSVETATDTGIAVVANTWYRVRLEVNAGGTSVTFSLASGLGGTLTASTGGAHTTNIPTGATRATGCGATILKSAGTTSRVMDVDLIEFMYHFTTER